MKHIIALMVVSTAVYVMGIYTGVHGFKSRAYEAGYAEGWDDGVEHARQLVEDLIMESRTVEAVNEV